MRDAKQRDETCLVDDGVEATAVSAGTYAAQRVHLDVADFTRKSGYAMHDVPIDHDA